MAGHIEVMQHAADTVNAATVVNNSISEFIDSVMSLVPKIGYTLTILAAFFPKPEPGAPAVIQWAYKVTHLVAFNVGHAANKQ